MNPMTPPFHEGITARLRSGALVRVSADGSPWVEPDLAEVELPGVDPAADPAVEPDTENPLTEDGAVGVPVDPTAPGQATPATLAEQRVDQQFAEQATTVAPMPRPLPTDRKTAWVTYAVSTGRITHEAADDLTRAELIARFGG